MYATYRYHINVPTERETGWANIIIQYRLNVENSDLFCNISPPSLSNYTVGSGGLLQPLPSQCRYTTLIDEWDRSVTWRHFYSPNATLIPAWVSRHQLYSVSGYCWPDVSEWKTLNWRSIVNLPFVYIQVGPIQLNCSLIPVDSHSREFGDGEGVSGG